MYHYRRSHVLILTSVFLSHSDGLSLPLLWTLTRDYRVWSDTEGGLTPRFWSGPSGRSDRESRSNWQRKDRVPLLFSSPFFNFGTKKIVV